MFSFFEYLTTIKQSRESQRVDEVTQRQQEASEDALEELAALEQTIIGFNPEKKTDHG